MPDEYWSTLWSQAEGATLRRMRECRTLKEMRALCDTENLRRFLDQFRGVRAAKKALEEQVELQDSVDRRMDFDDFMAGDD